MEPWQAALLGVVEGLTEFLPVSSTGHLILVSQWLGLQGESVKTFEVVIQSGALAAVLGLYRHRVAAMGRGLLGRDPDGRRLLANLFVSFLPAVAAGAALHQLIKARLFATWPVVAALAAGGIVMVLADRWLRGGRRRQAMAIDGVTLGMAALIGCAQCLALWPGTSRAMATMVAGMLLGLSATAAAEYSFLLALPTLGAATLLDLMKGGDVLLQELGGASVALGFVTAAVVAALAIRGFIQYLTRHGLALFGWYRIALAVLVWMVVPS
ncbi:MAG: undecaprenyl-diphosphate phosphatase [Candidatus Omnitrophica bacterium]|nr:undecaprenyl-diphosphate phosphatase [Candidatus Omnitrophota bacterium]